MPSYRMLVLSNPVEGHEEEFNDWYQNLHLPQMLSLPGFVSAERFRLARKLVEGEAYPYMTIYHIESDDIDATLQHLKDKAGKGELEISPTLDTASVQATIYEAIGA